MAGAVLVVGSVNSDLVVRVPRLPSPGETVLGDGWSRSPGGKGANQAVAAARLGARVQLLAEVGADSEGDSALETLAEEGVDVSLVGRSSVPTGLAAVLVDRRGENVIAVAPGANLELDPASAGRAIRNCSPETVVCASLEVPEETLLAALEAARERGLQVVLNLAPARPIPPPALAAVRVLVVNQRELQALAPEGAEGLLDDGPEAVLVTLGSEGADIFLRGQRRLRRAAPQVVVVDTTGAGDTLCGALAARLGAGDPLLDAVELAVRAAAMSVTGAGARTAMPRLDELLRAGPEPGNTSSGLLAGGAGDMTGRGPSTVPGGGPGRPGGEHGTGV